MLVVMLGLFYYRDVPFVKIVERTRPVNGIVDRGSEIVYTVVVCSILLVLLIGWIIWWIVKR